MIDTTKKVAGWISNEDERNMQYAKQRVIGVMGSVLLK